MRKAKYFQKSDERILGDSEFVDRVLSAALEQMEKKYALGALGITADDIAKISADLMNIEPESIYRPGKERSTVQARSLFCYWSTRELGISMTELSRQLKISLSAVCLAVRRGEKILSERKYSLTDLLKLH
jgi:chromosomal replication initiation ATPase DnaA